ncbi:endonuclease/exonuclease/phosphatase family protein [Arachidicoccus terrestris]|uniref:endonuclease/exonuclease/phosphatase family protein n=1 Tax=Arachidicoccus terrestris TaxID=2875539 RepID=UPI001CC7A782|nr:endonuclease/exonuclease/phosphatase family protein [Arachidicoccus terrestris]
MQRIYQRTMLLAVLVFSIAFISHAQKTTPVKNIQLKVMTFNTHHCNPPGDAQLIDVNGVANAIKRAAPDLVALQEIDVNVKRSGNIDEAAQIAARAGFKYYYFAKTLDLEGGQYGIAILSKFPLSGTATHQLPSIESLKGEPRVLATAVVHLPGGKKLTFASTHLDAYHKENRLLQIKEINQIAAGLNMPFIIGGDFNAHEQSEVIKTLDQQMTRTCENCPPTFDEGDASGAIDYVAYRPASKFKVLSQKVLNTVKASDHFPVMAVLQLHF